MSNPSDDQNDYVAPVPDIVLASIATAGSEVKASTSDPVTSVAGESTGGVDIEALALRVYALLREEVRVERERQVRD